MSITTTLEQTAIDAFVEIIGCGDIFPRVIAAVERVNLALPSGTSQQKRDKLAAEAKIIFDDLVEPLTESLLNLLAELAIQSLKTAAIATVV